ncbi:MAG: beta-galactosidase trimerization domain-containing protein, partial [Armatimonadota bacterium]|nr:beta-galactosidase trimerization domain-containing protein [Armatimonadota bacterium]
QIQRSNQQFVYVDHVRLYYDALHKRNITVDVICSDADISKYKLVITPTMFVLKEETAAKLREYVKSGGALITTFRIGVKDQYSRIVDEPLPGKLREIFGVKVEEYHSPWIEEVNRIKLKTGDPTESAVKFWIDVLKPETAEVIAEYSYGFAPGKPAITRNSFGAGTAIYVGTAPDKDFMAGFIKDICDKIGVKPGPDSAAQVEIASRRKGDDEYLFVLNHNDYQVEVESVRSGQELLTGKALSAPVKLEPFGVAIVKR